MPRSNRPRGRRREPDDDGLDLARALTGRLHTVTKRDGVWNVQPVGPASAVKIYVCPGCGGDVPPATAHVVTWRADGLFGEADDLAARRHWHIHCWRIRP
ncbi:hypothetical protein CLV46_1346 [Diaminobutyricimonas aerilata]|uniref:ATP/GTP-binding protein n=1 Tax=Diaminobutyricimonas aerilata TaxID=1162967 RepID=A0A2M9CIN9_9MICO|nr:hypothetical protein [Diaminobutyricimonas aerilata]PJJ71793.1 hypothetical protein CLV46_1346 [Diaminobutyricimonas aerilata]